MGERRGVYWVLVGKPEGKRTLGRPRRRWEDNIKMDLQEVGCGVWTGSSRLRIVTGGGLLITFGLYRQIFIEFPQYTFVPTVIQWDPL
jgi:hypothetical protein